jgi:hypothetical protein
MNRRYISNDVMNWEAEIKAARDELRLHGHEMSEYERNVISREIKKRQDELIPVVGAKVIGEYKQSIEKYQAAQAKIEAEKVKEINRFDSTKFNNELQALQARVKMTMDHPANPLRGKDKPVSVRIEEIYNEAIQSGDIHKQRAAIEVIKDIPITGNQDERIRINQLAKNAEAAEESLRQTEGTLKARAERTAAIDELDQRRETLNKVSTILGMGRADDGMNFNFFAKAYKQVQRDPATGEIKIYAEDAPEVTGVIFKG